jgi:hypothetical protein
VKVRYSTIREDAAFQVLVHLPKRAKTLLTQSQQEELVHPVIGEEMPTRTAARDVAALKCVEKLLKIGALDPKFKPVPPACVLVSFHLLLASQSAQMSVQGCTCCTMVLIASH